MQKIIETLPVAFQQYAMNLELNIGFAKKEKETAGLHILRSGLNG